MQIFRENKLSPIHRYCTVLELRRSVTNVCLGRSSWNFRTMFRCPDIQSFWCDYLIKSSFVWWYLGLSLLVFFCMLGLQWALKVIQGRWCWYQSKVRG